MYGYGLEKYFSDTFEIIDFSIVVITFTTTVITLAIDENNGDVNLDYNTLNNLPYLGKVIRETIRLWGVNFFDRTCVKDYFISELNYTVPKGMHVTIAGGKIMKDAANFANPLNFDPESNFVSNSPSPSKD